MTGKVDSVIRIPSSLKGSFFRYWLEFLKPFHKLTDREMDVATSFIKQRYELSKVIKDDAILNKVLMGEDTRKVIREECNISLPHFQVILGRLRKSGVILEDKINPKFIPNITESSTNYQLLLLFDLNEGK